MIRGDNPAAHCFALRDLISTTFCKQLVIFSLKMHSSGKIFGKISLRAVRDTIRWSDIKQKGKVQTFWLVERIPPPKKKNPSLSRTSWSPHKEKFEEGVWSAYCNDFEKSEWECFLSDQQIYICKGKDKKEVANSLVALNLQTVIHPFQGKKHLRT